MRFNPAESDRLPNGARILRRACNGLGDWVLFCVWDEVTERPPMFCVASSNQDGSVDKHRCYSDFHQAQAVFDKRTDQVGREAVEV